MLGGTRELEGRIRRILKDGREKYLVSWMENGEEQTMDDQTDTQKDGGSCLNPRTDKHILRPAQNL